MLEKFAESLRKAINETPAMTPPPEGGYPAPEPEAVPEIHADEDMNTCTLECELLRQILEHCGCHSTMADNIVQQAKLLGKTAGTLTVDHFDDLVGAAEFETPAGSPEVSNVSVMATPVIATQKYNESIKDETNEKFEVVETADEVEEEKE